jgi:TPR repeat protein
MLKWLGVCVFALGVAAAAPARSDPEVEATDWLRNVAEGGALEGRMILLDQALQGSAEAQFAMAGLYRAARDMSHARRWYLAAAGQGHAAALASLRSLAGDGDAAAFYALGVLSRDGLGVPRDPPAARQAFRWAAQGGHIPALFAAAEMMAAGHGGAVDENGAWRNYRQAARLAGAAVGDMTEPLQESRAIAQYWLGRIYLSGLGGIVQNTAQAARWFEQAASGGLAEAQLALARLYAQGRGVPQDSGQAAAWFDKAAAQGVGAADLMD